MQSCELTTAITALANAIFQTFSPEEVELLAVSFNQLGDTIATILVNENLIKKC